MPPIKVKSIQNKTPIHPPNDTNFPLDLFQETNGLTTEQIGTAKGKDANNALAEVVGLYKAINSRARRTERDAISDSVGLPNVLQSIAAMRHCEVARTHSVTARYKEVLQKSKASLKSLEIKLQNAVRENEELKHEKHQHLDMVSHLEEELTSLRYEKEANSSMLERAKVDQQESSKQIASLKTQLMATEKAEGKERRYAEKMSSLHEKVKAQNLELTQTVHSITAKNETLTADLEQHHKLKADLERKQQNLNQYLVVIKKGVIERSKMQHQLDCTVAAERRLIDAQKRLEDESKAQKQRNVDLQKALKAERERVEMLMAEKATLKRELEEQRRQRKESEAAAVKELEAVRGDLVKEKERASTFKENASALFVENKGLKKKEVMWSKQMKVLYQEVMDQERNKALNERRENEREKGESVSMDVVSRDRGQVGLRGKESVSEQQAKMEKQVDMSKHVIMSEEAQVPQPKFSLQHQVSQTSTSSEPTDRSFGEATDELNAALREIKMYACD